MYFVCCIQFKEIAQAYEILSDEKKREIYNKGGEDALKEGGGSDSHSAMDIFEMFFGGGGRRRQQEKRTKDMVYPLRVSYTCVRKQNKAYVMLGLHGYSHNAPYSLVSTVPSQIRHSLYMNTELFHILLVPVHMLGDP